MFARSKSLPLLGSGMACLLACGCSETPIEVAVASSEQSLTDSLGDHSEVDSSVSERAVEAQRSEPLFEEDVSEYQPPYPERIDLFAVPKQSSRVVTQSNGGTAESVVLLGFANLGTPSAVLSIDNVVHPIFEGQQIAGVEVISISPPQAVLQRGRSRWTTSIE